MDAREWVTLPPSVLLLVVPSPRWQLTLSLSSPHDLLFAAGWLRKTDAERILSIQSPRYDSVDEISQGDADTESLTRVFYGAIARGWFNCALSSLLCRSLSSGLTVL